MVKPYPASGKRVEPPPRPEAPSSVLNAVKLMYAGAAVATVYAIVSVVTIGAIKTALHKTDTKLTPKQLDNAATVLVAGTIIFSVIVIALWLWMAWASKEGKGWARPVATVLFGLNTLYMLGFVIQTRSIAVIFPAIDWLIGAVAAYLLWRPDSRAFFNGRGSA
jgi:UDP-N-acetylmuramyl pentapeptide phosphotransferase/UDP-N-acetylglucosamine-1-phosphate transferase